MGAVAFMTYDPEQHHRRSIRVASRDYAAVGSYFVTICTYDREELFGDIVAGCMKLNALGTIVARERVKTERVRPAVDLDSWVVMPNHIHGIIVLRTATDNRGTAEQVGLHSPSETIGAIVRGFKAAATRQINTHRGTPGVTVWQRNYYEHIIRNDDELSRIRAYIDTNPSRWNDDTLNPITHPQM